MHLNPPKRDLTPSMLTEGKTINAMEESPQHEIEPPTAGWNDDVSASPLRNIRDAMSTLEVRSPERAGSPAF